MLKYLILILLLIFAALGWMYVDARAPAVYSENFSASCDPHLASDADRSIKTVQLFVFYFVPKNRTEALDGDWQKILQANLDALKNFHNLQLRQCSRLIYKIYPQPVIGFKDNIEYNTEITQGGNPMALINVSEELENRVFKNTGDLFFPGFAEKTAGAYPVMAVMYEDVGAIGGFIHEGEEGKVAAIAEQWGLPKEKIVAVNVESVDGFFLISKSLLWGDFAPTKQSIFAHEFYHTLGIFNGYYELSETGRVMAVSEDVMGLGRFKPLDISYLDNGILKNLGL